MHEKYYSGNGSGESRNFNWTENPTNGFCESKKEKNPAPQNDQEPGTVVLKMYRPKIDAGFSAIIQYCTETPVRATVQAYHATRLKVEILTPLNVASTVCVYNTLRIRKRQIYWNNNCDFRTFWIIYEFPAKIPRMRTQNTFGSSKLFIRGK